MIEPPDGRWLCPPARLPGPHIMTSYPDLTEVDLESLKNIFPPPPPWIIYLLFAVRWFLVETNYDHWTTPPPSDDRRDPAIQALKKLGQAKVGPSTLFQVISMDHVRTNLTVYSAIMAAGNPDLLNAWVQRP